MKPRSTARAPRSSSDRRACADAPPRPGPRTRRTELVRLKGEMKALEKVSVQKTCGIQFERQAAR